MKRIILFPVLLLICMALASCQTTVHFFYGNGCPHCANVEASGVLEKIARENVTLEKHEIYFNSSNQEIFSQYVNQLKLPQNQRGIPLAVIECNGNMSYLVGDKPIIDNLEGFSGKCDSTNITNGHEQPFPIEKVTLTSIIVGAAVDSINPCAFAVLIFLIVTMLATGSKRRMLKAAIVYIIAVYITYFLAGLGIFRVIQSLTSVTHYVYLASGVIVLIAGLIEIKEFFWCDGKSILKIPDKAKPVIENIAKKGTLPAAILLGFLVSLFELPCTGGIYLAILTMMSQHQSFSMLYLLLYNLIFILPLVVITSFIYIGASPETIEKCRMDNRRWMKLAAGLVMIALGIYILLF